jgi:hypothetical protein
VRDQEGRFAMAPVVGVDVRPDGFPSLHTILSDNARGLPTYVPDCHDDR